MATSSSLLLEGTTGTEDAVKAAESWLWPCFSEPFHVDSHDLPITASIGIVERSIVGCQTPRN